MLLLVLLYEIAILFYPARLYWMRKSVKNAWRIAVAGGFLPYYVYFYLFKGPKYIIWPAILMCACYGCLGLGFRLWPVNAIKRLEHEAK